MNALFEEVIAALWLGYNPVIWSHPDESADLWIRVSFDVPQWWMLTWRPKTWSRHHFPVVKGGEPLPAMVLRTCEVPVMALGAHLFEESIYQGAWLTLVLHLSAEEVSRDMSNLLHQPSHSPWAQEHGQKPMEPRPVAIARLKPECYPWDGAHSLTLSNHLSWSPL